MVPLHHQHDDGNHRDLPQPASRTAPEALFTTAAATAPPEASSTASTSSDTDSTCTNGRPSVVPDPAATPKQLTIHNDPKDNPVRTLVHNWLLWGIFVPALGMAGWTWLTAATWEGLSVTALLLTALATPVLAIVQGSLGILQFRLRFGAAPVPVTPAHGVVYVQSDAGTAGDGRGAGAASDDAAGSRHPHRSLDEAAQQVPPVRLLVIGDSLAIGVGQRTSSTPVLPQVIAQTLSRKLQRVVYWTCHGAPGASTGWIVRELERGVASEEDDAQLDSDDGDISYDSSSQPSKPSYLQSIRRLVSRQSSSCQETSDLMNDDAVALWRNRLTAHRRRFNPELLGPYDIVVVLTGSNDLKSAFFPFLLTGEDAEFRRQAQQRGGSYTKELRLLLETLYEKMSVQIQNIRDQVLTQVEAATESVREKVEETMERIAPGRSFEQLFGGRPKSDSDGEPPDDGELPLDGRPPRKAPMLEPCDSNHTVTDESDDESDLASVQQGNSRHFPLVVLPGMPSRALPIFQTVPLRWLSCPIVDIMDRHKQELANLHPGQVLFVPAPPLRQVFEYEAGRGAYWEERSDEEVALCMRDPPRRLQDQKLEQAMQEYYATHKSWTWRKQSSLFAEDQIHPNDEGYDFWGRYIAHAIVDEWKEKDQL